MSGSRVVHRFIPTGRRRVVVIVAMVLALALVGTLFVARSDASRQQHSLQNISVQMGMDTTIYSISTATVTKDEDGQVVEEKVDLDPTQAAALLPVRVQTAWWHGDETGTDLAALSGRSGRFTIQVSVQDLTAEAIELSFETAGARYRQQALVGVPLTVVASAQVDDADRVVQQADGVAGPGFATATDGVLSETQSTGRAVQWASYLAPPMLSPNATFTLVVDSDDFVPPDFDITVQPGLVTDPSVTALVERAFGSDGYSASLETSTINLVLDVTDQLGLALDFVDDVHTTLVGDVSQLGEQTFYELKSSSETVLSHLESTAGEMDSILASAEDGISGVGAQTRTGVQALASSLDAVLGSSVSRPAMTQSVVSGCQMTMPVLAEGEERTVASTVFVADAQLQTIMDLFATGSGASSDNCRTALVDVLVRTIGSPSDLAGDPAAAAACESTAAGSRTVACALWVARQTLSTDFLDLALRNQDVWEVYSDLQVSELIRVLGGPDGLALALTDLRERLSAAQLDAGTLMADLGRWASGTLAVIEQGKAAVAAARAEVSMIAGTVGDLQAARDVLYTSVADAAQGVQDQAALIETTGQAVPTVGAWFTDSGYAAGLDALVVAVNAAATPVPAPAPSAEPDPDESTGTGTDTDDGTGTGSTGAGAVTDDGTTSAEAGDDGSADPASGGSASDGVTGADAEPTAGTGDDEVATGSATDVCDAGWADGLSADPTADELLAALSRLDDPACPAQALALSTQDLVTGYTDSLGAVGTMRTAASDAAAWVTDLTDQFADLDSALAELTDLTSVSGALVTQLAALYDGDLTVDHPEPTGVLAELETRVLALAERSGPDGDLAALEAELGELAALVGAQWPDDSVPPLTDAAACTQAQPGTEDQPAAAAQVVVWLSNRLWCLEADLGGSLQVMEQQIDSATASSSAELAWTSSRTQGAMDEASTQIGVLSDLLITSVAGQKEAAIASSLETIDAAREQMRAKLDQTLASFELTTSEVISQLTEAMDRSAAHSSEVAQSLAVDFANLIANLGDPDPTGRTGMLGKMYSITTQVGETGSVLDTVGSTTTAYGNARSSELRDIDLRASQFAAAQERLADYQPFVATDGSVVSVFVFHLRDEQ